MSREVENSNSEVVESPVDLDQIFIRGGRPLEKFKIGMEFERFLVDQTTLKALPFEGPRGIEKFLTLLADTSSKWEKVFDHEKLISLKCGDTAITLEPGGEVEISCRVYDTADQLMKGLTSINEKMVEVANQIGAKFIAAGIHPMETTLTNPWMPKTRYKWMREYYEKRGQSAFEMMLLTASIQVNFDYTDEKDCAKKVLVSSFLSPIFAACYANSSIEQGKPNGYATRRIPIWEKTDPDRCGTPTFFIDGTFSFEKYRDYALDVPMYFAFRNGDYVGVQNQTFRQFLEHKGGNIGPVTLGDWDFHLTTLFPEIRLKNHLEFRTADCNSIDLVVSLAAIWKGLFYDSSTVHRWFDFFSKYSWNDLQTSLRDVSRNGLSASFAGQKILPIAKKLLEDAKDFYRSTNDSDIQYLDAFEQILERGTSPGEVAVQEFSKKMQSA